MQFSSSNSKVYISDDKLEVIRPIDGRFYRLTALIDSTTPIALIGRYLNLLDRDFKELATIIKEA